MNDVRIGQPGPVDVGLEYEHLCFGLSHREVQLAAHLNIDLFSAMRALCLNFDRQNFAQEMPLHEGRCYRILRSSGEYFLSGAKYQPVRRFIRGDRERPRDRFALIPYKKE